MPALDVHLALKKRSSLHSNIIDVLSGILPSSSAEPSTTKSTSGAIQPGLTKNDKQNRYYIILKIMLKLLASCVHHLTSQSWPKA